MRGLDHRSRCPGFSEAGAREEPERLASWSGRRTGVVLFLFLLGVYHMNFSFLPGDDATPNVYLPVGLLERGSLSFRPEETPFMFEWRVVGTEVAPRTLSTVGWRPNSRAWPESLGYSLEQLECVRERYFLVPARREGEYASTFGIGAGLFALPVFAVARWVLKFEEYSDHLLWHLGKLAASIAVAGSAVLVYLTAARFVPGRAALLIALVYGLGTCVWSISSQTLWQHGPSAFFLAFGCYFCLKPTPGGRDWAFCGFCWGMAVLCRPSSAMAAIVMGGWLLIRNRKALGPYVAGGVPVALALGVYHWRYFGVPWTFGQTERGKSVALEKTGSPELWQTPLWEGLAGLLVSPGRGLFVYSPVVLVAVWGISRIWRERQWEAFRPLTLCALGLLVVAAKWFDWWGGWTYGYRPIVDAMPLLALFMVPVMGRVWAGVWRAPLFALLLSWSVMVQFTGAFAYDLVWWNNLGGRNVDLPEHRHRLWSWRENPVTHYMLHFPEGWERRRQVAGREGAR